MLLSSLMPTWHHVGACLLPHPRQHDVGKQQDRIDECFDFVDRQTSGKNSAQKQGINPSLLEMAKSCKLQAVLTVLRLYLMES